MIPLIALVPILRAVLRDASSERVGSASQFIEVPDIKKNRLTLSGIVVDGVDPAAKEAKPQAEAGQPPATAGRMVMTSAESDLGLMMSVARSCASTLPVSQSSSASS